MSELHPSILVNMFFHDIMLLVRAMCELGKPRKKSVLVEDIIRNCPARKRLGTTKTTFQGIVVILEVSMSRYHV